MAFSLLPVCVSDTQSHKYPGGAKNPAALASVCAHHVRSMPLRHLETYIFLDST